MPIIEDHTAPLCSINLTNFSPNFAVKIETKKNLKPLEIKLIIINEIISNAIKPLVIVKTLYGKGVKPARNKVPSHMTIPLP